MSRKTEGPAGAGGAGRPGLLPGLATFAFRRPLLTLGLAGLLTLFALWSAGRLQVDPDIAKLLPEDAQSVRDLKTLRHAFGGTGYVTILASGADRKTLERFAADAAKALEALPEIRYVEFRRPVAFFRDRLLYYLPLRDLKEIQRRIARRVKWEKARANPLFVDVDDEPAPPVKVGDILDRQKKALTKRRLLDRGGDPYLVDRQGKRLLLLVRPVRGSTDLRFSRRVLEQVRRTVARVRAASFPKVQVAYSGRYTKRVDQQAGIVVDLKWSSLLALGLVLLYLVLHFGSVQAVLLLVAPLLLGLAWTFGWAGVAVGTLNLLSAFVGVILVGLGIDTGIHLLGRYQAERRGGASAEAAVRAMVQETGSGVLLAAATTAVGFGVLAASDFRGFQEFGLIAAGGMILQMASYLLVLPALLALSHRLRRGRVMRAPPWSQLPIYGRVHTWAPGVTWLAILGFVVVAFLVPQVRFEYDFAALNRQDLPSVRIDREVNALMGHSQTPLAVLASGEAGARQVAAAVRARQRKKPMGVDFVATLGDFLPPEQQAKHRVLTAIARDLADASPESLAPKDRKRLGDLRRMAKAPPFGVADLPVSVRRLFLPVRGTSQAVLVFPGIRLTEGQAVRTLAQGLRKLPDPERGTVSAAGEAMVMADVLDRVFAEAPKIVALAIVLIVLVIGFSIRRLRATVLITVSLVLSLGATLGLMPLFGIRFNYLNITVVPVLLGMAADGTIHLVLRAREPDFFPHTCAEVARAIAGSHLTTMLGFGALLLAHNPGLRSMAYLGLLGQGVSLLINVLVIPALLATSAVLAARRDEVPRARPPRAVQFLVTVGGAGYSRWAPGTVGALAALPAGWALARLDIAPRVAVLLGATAASLWLVSRFLLTHDEHDPQEVVIDEYIGVLVALAFVPWSWPWWAAAVVLFRLFDIWKPWPIRWVDRKVRGAWGVMGDDVLAGLVAGLLLLTARGF